MYEYSTIFGMDTHARSVTIRAIVVETGEVQTKKFGNCPTPFEISEWIKGFPGPQYAAYESGCTGFYLCRELRKLGITCDVIAVSSIARSTDDKIKKNDRRDAKRLAAELLNPANDLARVWLPDEECEGARDLSRAYADAVDAMKRAKLQLIAFLLRHGYVYSEKTKTGKWKKTFTRSFYSWLSTLNLEAESARLAYEMHLNAAKETIERARVAKEVLDAYKEQSRFKPYVDALSVLKGVGEIGAFAYAVEIGDFSRFKTGRKLPSWTGLTPKQYDSGDKNASGTITKAGNSHVRRYLMEGSNSLVYQGNGQPKALRRDNEVSDAIRIHANKGSRRLVKKIKRLKERGKESNIIKVACASEMIRWVWAIGLMVQQEQQQLVYARK